MCPECPTVNNALITGILYDMCQVLYPIIIAVSLQSASRKVQTLQQRLEKKRYNSMKEIFSQLATGRVALARHTQFNLETSRSLYPPDGLTRSNMPLAYPLWLHRVDGMCFFLFLQAGRKEKKEYLTLNKRKKREKKEKM